jgi:vancomycin resistance protein YoaR
MTYANGYRYAPIIISGEFVDGIGGGVCQISSTLYMALLYAELEIVERRNHSRRVGYIGWAMDATLAGDWIDLRWRNTTTHPGNGIVSADINVPPSVTRCSTHSVLVTPFGR